MSTIKQKKLAHNIVKNLKKDKPLNKKELLVSAGYDVTTAEATPNREITAKGVQDELKNLGFDPEKAKETVGEILRFGENDNVKLKAADMIFKTYGTYAPDKSISLNVDIETSEKVKQAAQLLNELYRGRNISSDGISPRTLGTETSD